MGMMEQAPASDDRLRARRDEKRKIREWGSTAGSAAAVVTSVLPTFSDDLRPGHL